MRKKRIINPDEVIYAAGDGNYSRLYFADNTNELMSNTLARYQEQWPHFLRISKQSLINPAFVQNYSQWSFGHFSRGGTVAIGNKNLTISRRKLTAIMAELNKRTNKKPSTYEHKRSRANQQRSLDEQPFKSGPL